MSKSEANVQRTSIIPFGVCSSASPDDASVTIYQSGGLAVVREKRRVSLLAGPNQVYLEGLPTQYQLNSLVVVDYAGEGELTLGPVSYRAANLDKARVLQGSVGKPVTVQLTQNNGRVVNVGGTLRAVLGNELAVERADNHRLILVPSAQVELKELPAGLSSTPSLMMAPTATAEGNYDLSLLYEAGGLGWSARYFAFYDEKANKLSRLEASVAITNRSGARFANALVKLLAGANYAAQADYGYESAGGGMALAAAAPMKRALRGRAAQVETVGDVKMYPLPERVTIADGETQQVTLFLAKDVPVKREYFLGAGGYDNNPGEEPQKLPVYVRLRACNKAESNLGAALPAGEVSILQPDSAGDPQKTFTANLDACAQGEDFKLEFGPSADIKAQRELLTATEYDEESEEGDQQEGDEGHLPIKPLDAVATGGPGMPGDRARDIAREVVTGGPARRKPVEADEDHEPAHFREEHRQLTVYNYKSEPVEVLVSDVVPENAEFIDKPESFLSDGSNGVGCKLAVEANGLARVSYKVRWQTNA